MPGWTLALKSIATLPCLMSVSKTRPSALGMSDPVMESLEILGTPEFSNLWRVEGYEGENDEKVVKKDEKQWKIMKKW